MWTEFGLDNYLLEVPEPLCVFVDVIVLATSRYWNENRIGPYSGLSWRHALALCEMGILFRADLSLC